MTCLLFVKNKKKKDDGSLTKIEGKFLGIVKGSIGWFACITVLQFIAVIMVTILILVIIAPVLGSVASIETWGTSHDLMGADFLKSNQIGSGGVNIKNYAQYFTMNEADIAKMPTNHDKNMYRFISLCVMLDKEYNVKLAPVVVGSFVAEGGGSFFNSGADTKNILEDLSDIRQKNGSAIGPLQLDGDKGDYRKYEVGGYKPKNMNGSFGEQWLEHQYTPYSIKWTYQNMTAGKENGGFFEEGTKSMFQMGDNLKKYMQVYGIEDSVETRTDLFMQLAYFRHHGATFCFKKLGEKWLDTCSEMIVAMYAVSGKDISNIRLTTRNNKWVSEDTKAPFFGAKFARKLHPKSFQGGVDFITLRNGYSLTVKGEKSDVSLMEFTRRKLGGTSGSTINNSIETIKYAKENYMGATAAHLDVMQSTGICVVGNEVIRDQLEKLGINPDEGAGVDTEDIDDGGNFDMPAGRKGEFSLQGGLKYIRENMVGKVPYKFIGGASNVKGTDCTGLILVLYNHLLGYKYDYTYTGAFGKFKKYEIPVDDVNKYRSGDVLHIYQSERKGASCGHVYIVCNCGQFGEPCVVEASGRRTGLRHQPISKIRGKYKRVIRMSDYVKERGEK